MGDQPLPATSFMQPDTRYIVILNSIESDAYLKALTEEERKKQLDFWGSLAETTYDAASTTIKVTTETVKLLWIPYTIYAVIAWGSEKTKSVMAQVLQLQNSGFTISVMPYLSSKAIKTTCGKPRTNTLYVRHPFKDNFYYTAAEYSHVALQETFSELVAYFRQFNPRRIEISMSRSSGVSVESGKELAMRMSTSHDDRSQDMEVVYTGEWDGTKIQMKEEVRLAWLEGSPVASVVNKQALIGAKKVELELTYHESFGVSEEFKMFNEILKTPAFSWGGKVESKQGTRLRIVAVFQEEKLGTGK